MRKRIPSCGKRGTVFAGLLSTMALIGALPCLAAAVADDGEVVAYSIAADGTHVNYKSQSDAINAGYEGKVIYLEKDWSSFGVADSKSLTINMNGHKITSQGDGTVIRLYEKSNLTLTSNITRTFDYKAYSSENGGLVNDSIDTGGLVTGGVSSNEAGGIRMDNKSTLTISNVAVAGNKGNNSGGIYVKKECTVNMSKGATVAHNTGEAGGIEFHEADSYLNMDAASISDNYATSYGGGVESDADATRITMENNSTIARNKASNGGGGVHFSGSFFYIVSKDKTASITDNTADGSAWGGGIDVDKDEFGQNEGRLEGLTVSGNSTDNIGGGIALEQEYTRVVECTVKDNSCKNQGGGIYDGNDYNSLEGCSVTDNTCALKGCTSRGGAGVYVSCSSYVTLSGKCTIKDNVRKEDSTADDLFLATDASYSSIAYFTNGVTKGSKVGVRSPSDEDRTVGKKLITYTSGTYFSDLSGRYISYEGDLVLRFGEHEFSLAVGDEKIGSYKNGDTVAVNGVSSDSSKHFWYWSEDDSSGLQPFSDYVNDIYSPAVSFTMPGNNVTLGAVYAYLAKYISIDVANPSVCEDLPGTVSIAWSDGTKQGVPVTWVDATGAVATKAEYGGKYQLRLAAEQDSELGLFFAESLNTSSVQLFCGTSLATVESASVDDSGTLNVASGWFEMPKPEVESVDSAAVSVTAGASTADLTALLPSTASVQLQGGKTALLATDKSNIDWPKGLLDDDGNVADPASAAAEYTVSLPLAATDEVKSVEGKALSVTITVLADTNVAAPALSLPAGTYSKYGSVAKLGDDLTLKLAASCVTEGAHIEYSVDGGSAQTYDANTGIVLTGAANSKATHNIEAWAVKTAGGQTVESEHVTAAYVLDDTLQKSITVSCNDTALYVEGDERWGASFDVTGDLGASLVITAPAQDGHVFDHWEWDGASEGADLNQSTLCIDAFSLDYNDEITAVYKPVISTIDVGIEAPQAHKELASAAEYVKVGIGSSAATTDITGYFSDHGAINWSPTASGAAEHLTAYTAMLSLKASEASGNVQYALADKLTLLVNGSEVGSGVYMIEVADGSKALCIDLPITGPYEYASLEELGDVSLSYEQACGYQAGQDAGKKESWGLSNQILVGYKCGETEPLDIEWGSVEGFDKNVTGAQTLTATGKITYPEYVDNSTDDGGLAPSTVTVKIKVAAPAASGSDEATDSDSSASPAATAALAKVTGVKAKATGKKRVKVTWAASKDGRSGVQIRYSYKKGMKKAKTVTVKSAKAAKKVLKKLKRGKKVFIQVRAYEAANGQKTFGAWSAKAKVKVK